MSACKDPQTLDLDIFFSSFEVDKKCFLSKLDYNYFTATTTTAIKFIVQKKRKSPYFLREEKGFLCFENYCLCTSVYITALCDVGSDHLR